MDIIILYKSDKTNVLPVALLYNGSFSHHLNIGYCFFINNYYLKQPLTTHMLSLFLPFQRVLAFLSHPGKSHLCTLDPTIKRWHPIKLFYSRKIVSENALLPWHKPEVSSYHTPYKKFLLKVQLSTYSNESNPTTTSSFSYGTTSTVCTNADDSKFIYWPLFLITCTKLHWILVVSSNNNTNIVT